jgi:predicted RNA binding protein YcfA (HicA-like mRNA interferase family)
MANQGLPVLSGRKICKALINDGFYMARRKGSHMIFKKKLNPKGTLVTVVPDHKEVADGTLDEILEQTHLTIDELLYLTKKRRR